MHVEVVLPDVDLRCDAGDDRMIENDRESYDDNNRDYSKEILSNHRCTSYITFIFSVHHTTALPPF